jgi:hypothetical protein
MPMTPTLSYPLNEIHQSPTIQPEIVNKNTPIRWNNVRVSALLNKARDLIMVAGDGGQFKSTHHQQIAVSLEKETIFRGCILNAVTIKNKLNMVLFSLIFSFFYSQSFMSCCILLIM